MKESEEISFLRAYAYRSFCFGLIAELVEKSKKLREAKKEYEMIKRKCDIYFSDTEKHGENT
jgi:hypothetical protein